MNIKKLVASAALVAAAASPLAALAADDIKVGALFPLSGPMALLGNEAYKAAQVAREMINEGGGVLGKQVSFATADAADPTSANAEATRSEERRVGKECRSRW